MANRNSLFWWYWLLGSSAGMIMFGLGFILLPERMLDLFNWLLYTNSPRASPFTSPAVTYIVFAHRVLGAVMIGWGVCFLFIIGGFWKHEGSLAWYTVAISILTWFIPDTTISIMGGFVGNAFLNGVFLVAFAIPLLATYKRVSLRAG